MATHSSILAWRIPRTEEPGRLQSMGSQSWTRLKQLSAWQSYGNHLNHGLFSAWKERTLPPPHSGNHGCWREGELGSNPGSGTRCLWGYGKVTYYLWATTSLQNERLFLKTLWSLENWQQLFLIIAWQCLDAIGLAARSPAQSSPWWAGLTALEIQDSPQQSNKSSHDLGLQRLWQIVKITRWCFKHQGFLKY